MTTVEVTDDAALGVTQVPLKGIRRIAARRMVTAWAAPVFHLTVEVDMTSALAVGRRPGATVTDVLLLATARALLANPGLNAHYADEVVSLHAAIRNWQSSARPTWGETVTLLPAWPAPLPAAPPTPWS